MELCWRIGYPTYVGRVRGMKIKRDTVLYLYLYLVVWLVGLGGNEFLCP